MNSDPTGPSIPSDPSANLSDPSGPSHPSDTLHLSSTSPCDPSHLNSTSPSDPSGPSELQFIYFVANKAKSIYTMKKPAKENSN